MRKQLFQVITMSLMSFASFVVSAKSELQSYVEQCESELGFNAGDVQPMNCNDGVNFARGHVQEIALVNDYLVYRRVNDSVDMTAVCRWVDPSNAMSVELIIHNRSNAKTCFFSAKSSGINFNVPLAIISPTNFSTVHSDANPNADDFWSQPSDLDNEQLPSDENAGISSTDRNGVSIFPDDILGNANLPLEGTDSARCVGCHVAGPYIASVRIAPYLAKYGLLNDGHDTVADFTAPKHYHVVGSNRYEDPVSGSNAFKSWDYFIAKNLVLQQYECSDGCHSIADKSTIGTLMANPSAPITVSLLPSIYADIAMIRTAGNVMPPSDPHSNYRWMNHSNASGTGDWELLKDEASQFPGLYNTCSNPTRLEAHVVGSDYIFATDDLPDRLHTFNLRDGLECRNAEQSNGKCNNYQTRYLCTVPNGDPVWTDWVDNDSPAGNGDYERRTDPGYANLCAIYNPKNLRITFVGTPVAMQAQTQVTKTLFDPIAKKLVQKTYNYTGYAPNDQLRNFDPSYGLACAHEDQSNGGRCSNYVVRFDCN